MRPCHPARHSPKTKGSGSYDYEYHGTIYIWITIPQNGRSLPPPLPLPLSWSSKTAVQWDLSQLPPHFRRKLSPERGSNVRGSGSSKAVVFDMSEDHFKHWVCDDVLGAAHDTSPSPPVVTLSTVVYPLPLLARNPTYASHPILAGTPHGARAGFAGGGQRRIEALETLLTRVVLRPTSELRERARELAGRVREEAAVWGRGRGLEMGQPPRVVGLHVRTYFVNAVSSGTVRTGCQVFFFFCIT